MSIIVPSSHTKIIIIITNIGGGGGAGRLPPRVRLKIRTMKNLLFRVRTVGLVSHMTDELVSNR